MLARIHFHNGNFRKENTMKNNNQYILSKECVIIMHTESLLDFLDYILKNVNPEEPDIDNYKVTEIDFKLNNNNNSYS